ncbi:MAG TPA: urea carboxylase-associated family protein [Synergistales bacterium]|nr:urea carboxylase-associated family protein [Synergistales bacterium]
MKGFLYYRKEILVPGGYARAFEIEKGDRITLIDVEGGQVCVFVAFYRDRLSEFLSPAHTRLALNSVSIRGKDRLRSNLLRPLLEVTENTAPTHDFLMPACDSWVGGTDDHHSCIGNFEGALAPWEISRNQVPEPLNVFGNTLFETDGTLVRLPPVSKPGDRLTLTALLPLVCAVSACPREPLGPGKTRVSDISVIVSHGDEVGKT